MSAGVKISSEVSSPVPSSEQTVRQMLDAKRQDVLRLRSVDIANRNNDDAKDHQRLKEEKARLARQQAIQVGF